MLKCQYMIEKLIRIEGLDKEAYGVLKKLFS